MTKFNGKKWVTELSEKAQKELKVFYSNKLKEEGIYTKGEVKEYTEDLINEKLGNIEDSVGIDYLIKLSHMD